MEKAQVERTEDRARERAKLYHQPCKGGLTGLVYFDPTDAYHFSLNLPEKFSRAGAHFFAQLDDAKMIEICTVELTFGWM